MKNLKLSTSLLALQIAALAVGSQVQATDPYFELCIKAGLSKGLAEEVTSTDTSRRMKTIDILNKHGREETEKYTAVKKVATTQGKEAPDINYMLKTNATLKTANKIYNDHKKGSATIIKWAGKGSKLPISEEVVVDTPENRLMANHLKELLGALALNKADYESFCFCLGVGLKKPTDNELKATYAILERRKAHADEYADFKLEADHIKAAGAMVAAHMALDFSKDNVITAYGIKKFNEGKELAHQIPFTEANINAAKAAYPHKGALGFKEADHAGLRNAVLRAAEVRLAFVGEDVTAERLMAALVLYGAEGGPIDRNEANIKAAVALLDLDPNMKMTAPKVAATVALQGIHADLVTPENVENAVFIQSLAAGPALADGVHRDNLVAIKALKDNDHRTEDQIRAAAVALNTVHADKVTRANLPIACTIVALADAGAELVGGASDANRAAVKALLDAGKNDAQLVAAAKALKKEIDEHAVARDNLPAAVDLIAEGIDVNADNVESAKVILALNAAPTPLVGGLTDENLKILKTGRNDLGATSALVLRAADLNSKIPNVDHKLENNAMNLIFLASALGDGMTEGRLNVAAAYYANLGDKPNRVVKAVPGTYLMAIDALKSRAHGAIADPTKLDIETEADTYF